MIHARRTRFGLGIQLRTWQFGFGIDWDAEDDEGNDAEVEWYAWAAFGPFVLDLTRYATVPIDYVE